jgi:sulfite oxidase
MRRNIFKNFKNLFFFTTTTVFMGTNFTYKKYLRLHTENKPLNNNNIDVDNTPMQLSTKSLPTYTRKEVGEHYTVENRIWTTYKDGVYDITDFIKVHPGGDEKIKMVAGGALEPFWEMYSFHKKSDIEGTLKKYRIGNLDPKDILDPKSLPNFDNLKKDLISRSEFLFVHQNFPFCAEGPSEKFLLENFYTPDKYFFVRNHNAIPSDINPVEYKLKLTDSLSSSKISFTIEDLKKNYKAKTVETIMMCTGNRRSQMTKPTATKGLPWNVGAIANGLWSGVLMKDILTQMGYNKSNAKGKHLIATGMDKDMQGSFYSVSIPLEVVFSDDTDVIIAYSYNNEEIPFEHGYPLRLVIPGYVGVRNVKWLKSLEISDKESQGPFQQRDYKIIPKDVEWDSVDLSTISPLMTHVINSAIYEPKSGKTFKEGEDIVVKGWAIGNNGSKINKIEISFDQGSSWSQIPEENLKYNVNEKGKVFGWTIWQCNLDTKGKRGETDIWLRAYDEEGNSQPISDEEIWNVRGLMNNSVHKVKINIL